MNTKQILEILRVFAWILFVGMCIKTGAMLVAVSISLFVNAIGAKDLYLGMNLYDVLRYGKLQYILLVSLIAYLSGLKAYLFLQVIRTISSLNIQHPFSEAVAGLISKMGQTALQIGILALIVQGNIKWLMKRDVTIGYDNDDTAFLFLAGILFVITQIFRRGIELQSENELTI